MAFDEDQVSSSYKYLWTKVSDLPLQEFLTKYRPSAVQNDGTKPWIWVSKPQPTTEEVNEEEAQKEAKAILEETTEKVEAIKNDDTIPVRANKKKGLKSKKELREEVQAEATEKLKDVSLRYNFLCGKWLIFAAQEKVDAIWSTIAKSLIEGPLSSTCAYRAKVSTSPPEETPNPQHVMCLYMPDVYDKGAVTEVMKVLLGDHGLNLMGVKSDLYTVIGLDSKHPSGIQSTIWKNTALMKDTEIKTLKDKYFKELEASKATEKKGEPSKPKHKPKKKAVDNDPFVTDDDQEEEGPSKSKPSQKSESKGKSKPVPKKKVQDNFVSDDENAKDVDSDDSDGSEVERRRRKAKARKLESGEFAGKRDNGKRRKTDESDDDNSDEEETRPKKRRTVGRK